MANLKKLKKATIGLFWKEQEARPQELSPQPTYNLESMTVPAAPSAPNPPAEVNREFYSAIEKELAKATPSEFNEFYSQLSVINEKFANLDETTRYQLAFHAAQTALKARNQSLTPSALVKSLAKMNELLDAEKREFTTQNEQSYQSNLDALHKKVQEINQNVKSRESRLQALQQELESFLAAKNAEKKKLEDERAQYITQRVTSEGEMHQLEKKKLERESKFNVALDAHQQRLERLKNELLNRLKDVK